MLNKLANMIWVVEPKTHEIVEQVLVAKLTGQERNLAEIEASLGRPMVNERPEKPYEVYDGVAVIPVHGLIGKRFNMFSAMSGGVSTELLQTYIEDALTDPNIVAVVLDADSPGGTVDGTAELGDWMLENRNIKPTFTHVGWQCCSGMLWLASCFGPIHAFRTSQIGSLSARVGHTDRSGADAKAGIKRTIIVSGPYKAMANDSEPLSSEGKEYLQHFIDRYHAMFVEAVAEGKGMSPAEVQVKFGDGKVHLAAEALEIGMIDAVGTLKETINAARDAAMEEQNMNKAELAAKYPELHASLIQEGRDAATAEFEGQVQTQGDALVSGEQERLFGLYAKLHGAEKGAAFTKLAQSGLSAVQLEGLEGFGFGVQQEAAVAVPVPKEKGTSEKILAALESEGVDVAAGTGGGAPTNFMAAVDDYVVEQRTAGTPVSRINAIKAVAKKHPELYETYKEGGAR